MSLLDVKNLQVSYGGIQAVRGIDFHINKGELVTLIGANGAGKTTTLKTLVGMVKKSGGSITCDGKETDSIASYNFARNGLVMVPEARRIFGKLTVEENLQMGGYHRNDKDGIQRDIERGYELFPRLKERQKQLAGTLSGGEQQMVAMARAIISQPKLLLLDEPSMGLAPLIVEKIFEIIQMVAKEGVTMLLVEQNAKLALEVSQRGYVMESGRITMSGPAQELLADERVRNAYLGD